MTSTTILCVWLLAFHPEMVCEGEWFTNHYSGRGFGNGVMAVAEDNEDNAGYRGINIMLPSFLQNPQFHDAAIIHLLVHHNQHEASADNEQSRPECDPHKEQLAIDTAVAWLDQEYSHSKYDGSVAAQAYRTNKRLRLGGRWYGMTSWSPDSAGCK